jgi:hypothetical protein
MVAFKDESVVDAQKGSFRFVKNLQSHYKTIVCSKGSFRHPKFSSQQIPDPLTSSLTVQHGFINVHNELSAKTVTDSFSTKGGGVTML